MGREQKANRCENSLPFLSTEFAFFFLLPRISPKSPPLSPPRVVALCLQSVSSLSPLSFVFTALLRLLFARWINLSLLSKKLLTLRFIADPFGKYEQDGGRVGSRPSGVAASRASVKGERQRVPPSLPPPSLECSSRDGKRRFRRRSERERAG